MLHIPSGLLLIKPRSHGRNMVKARGIDWELTWEKQSGIHVAQERAASRNGSLSRVVSTRYFAVVRSAYDADGLYDERQGFVVSRNSFDDLRQFPTLDEAKLYVESIYELEKS